MQSLNQSRQTSPLAKAVSNALSVRRLMIIGLGCLATLTVTVLSKTTPAQAGWDWNGVNWCGVWDTNWGSSTGSYNSQISVKCSGQVGPATGTYNNGTLNGYTYYHRDSFGNVTALRFKGTWKRTQGNSGGSCNYGQFSLDLVASGTDRYGNPSSKFFGPWTYCNNDPESLTQQWAWYGFEKR